MGDTIDYFNILSVKSLNLNKEDFSKGIQHFILNNRDDKDDLTNKCLEFKKKATFFNLLNLLRYNNLFCIIYELNEG